MTEYFFGSLLDMLSVERKPPAFDIHGFSLRLRTASDGLAPVARLNQRFSGVSISGVSIQWLRDQAARRWLT
jgi:hypothetical protein